MNNDQKGLAPAAIVSASVRASDMSLVWDEGQTWIYRYFGVSALVTCDRCEDGTPHWSIVAQAFGLRQDEEAFEVGEVDRLVQESCGIVALEAIATGRALLVPVREEVRAQ